MARPTEWRRSAQNYVPTTGAANIHQVKLCDLAPGETLTRVRFNWWAGQEASALPLAGEGVSFALGIQAYEGNLPTDNPLTSPNADWLWWEWFTMTSEVFGRDDDNTFVNSMIGTNMVQERDVKAQRAAGESPMTVWLQTAGFNAAQGFHDLSYGASCLVLLAP